MSAYVFVCSNVSEESKQQSSELSEQLKLSTQENGAMRLELEDLRKRLEIADLMLQQVSSYTLKLIFLIPVIGSGGPTIQLMYLYAKP